MTIVVNNWRLDPSRNALVHVETGEIRRLGEYHYALLITFISHANNVLSRQYLMAEVWKNRVVGTNSLPTAIHALRVALDDNGKQQEIIKTVPKKGYIFSKEFISEWQGEIDDFAPAIPEDIPVVPPSEEPESRIESAAAPPPPVAAAQPVQRVRRHRTLGWIVGGIALAGVALAVFYPRQPAPTSVPSMPLKLKNESYPAADRVTIVHVVNSNLAESSTPSLQNHLAPMLEQLNRLLEKHQSTATLFYHITPGVFSTSMLVNNQCNVTWQVISSLENWQGHDREMGERLYSSVERTINEMPACNKK